MSPIHIILHGGDDTLEAQLSLIIQYLPQQKSIAYITIALEQIKPLEKIERAFNKIIIPSISAINPIQTTLITSDNLSEIYAHNIIIISGGDTTHLMQVFNQNNVAEKLKSDTHTIEHIVGISAGAIALCRQGISRKDNQDLLIKGMSLIPGTMLPHAETWPERIKQFNHLPDVISLGREIYNTRITPIPKDKTASPTCYIDEFPEYSGLDDIQQQKTPTMPIIPENTNLFIIDIEYIVPLEQVEPHLEKHMQFLQKHYKAGNFLTSGPKIPRSGGVIVAVSKTRKEIEQLIQNDPFYSHKLAHYTITEFVPRAKAEGL